MIRGPILISAHEGQTLSLTTGWLLVPMLTNGWSGVLLLMAFSHKALKVCSVDWTMLDLHHVSAHCKCRTRLLFLHSNACIQM